MWLRSRLQARLQCGALAWRPRPVRPHEDARCFQERRRAILRRQRRRRARPRYSGRQPRLQFRRALPCRRLCPPHRPHRPRGTHGHAYMLASRATTRSMSTPIEKLTGKPMRRRVMEGIEVRENNRREAATRRAAIAATAGAGNATDANAVRANTPLMVKRPAMQPASRNGGTQTSAPAAGPNRFKKHQGLGARTALKPQPAQQPDSAIKSTASVASRNSRRSHARRSKSRTHRHCPRFCCGLSNCPKPNRVRKDDG